MAPRFDRNPFVVASYFLKLSLEIRSVVQKQKKNQNQNVSNTYKSKFFYHMKGCGTWSHLRDGPPKISSTALKEVDTSRN